MNLKKIKYIHFGEWKTTDSIETGVCILSWSNVITGMACGEEKAGSGIINCIIGPVFTKRQISWMFT